MFVPGFIGHSGKAVLLDLAAVVDAGQDGFGNEWSATSKGNKFLKGASANKVDGNYNVFDGVKDNKVDGKNNNFSLKGSSNKVKGNFNNVKNSGNSIDGDHNTVTGSGATITGSYNTVACNGCRVVGNRLKSLLLI